jgi:hypothetical protein
MLLNSQVRTLVGTIAKKMGGDGKHKEKSSSTTKKASGPEGDGWVRGKNTRI